MKSWPAESSSSTCIEREAFRSSVTHTPSPAPTAVAVPQDVVAAMLIPTLLLRGDTAMMSPLYRGSRACRRVRPLPVSRVVLDAIRGERFRHLVAPSSDQLDRSLLLIEHHLSRWADVFQRHL